MKTLITTPTNTNQALTTREEIGQLANQIAQQHAFIDYRSRKAHNTLRRQDADLALFERFLNSELKRGFCDLANDPAQWVGITWGLVEGFRNWQLREGYAVGSVNIRLSTVKTYAKLATKAGIIPTSEYSLICLVDGYAHKEKARIDRNRDQAGVSTRYHKKSKGATVNLTEDAIIELLESLPDTAQGRRDRLIITLLADHGLRVSELHGLKRESIHLKKREMCFYRPKVDNTGCHILTREAYAAARDYLTDSAHDLFTTPADPLLRGTNKSGKFTTRGMSKNAIARRVRALGERVGIESLSPHDLRHYAATKYAKAGHSIDRLMDIFGWASPAMAIRYIEKTKVTRLQ